jgi:hypothetical protein
MASTGALTLAAGDGSVNEHVAGEGAPAPLVAGSVTAKALYAAWSGERTIIVDSPPGSGKTELCTTVAAHLARRSDLTVTIAAATRDQVVATANRLATQLPAENIVVTLRGAHLDLTAGIQVRASTTAGGRGGSDAGRTVELRTLAHCGLLPPACDILIVDEAYQSTFALVSRAAAGAAAVLLIGDPGQIGPVVTADTAAWEHRRLGPHRRAPEAFANIGTPTNLYLTTTWRLGAQSAHTLAPLYGFTWMSGRGDRRLDGLNEIESFQLAPTATCYDPDTLTIVAEHAAALCDTTLIDHRGRRTLDPDDVAVIVSHNAQASGISGLLASMGINGVTVGTADRLQGGQWPAVVAIDPFLAGHDGLSAHALSLGRLCTMASRHTTHLSWFHDGQWETAIGDATISGGLATAAKTVRRRLCAT